MVPWAVALGVRRAVVTLAGALPRWPAWWVMVAGAALGAGAHFANAIPDLDDDRATGVTGLPHRLGRHGSLLATAVLVITGQALVTLAIGSVVVRVVVTIIALPLVVVFAVAITMRRDRLAFHVIVGLLLLLATGVLLGGAV